MRRKTFEDTKTKVSLLNSQGNIALLGEKIKRWDSMFIVPHSPDSDHPFAIHNQSSRWSLLLVIINDDHHCFQVGFGNKRSACHFWQPWSHPTFTFYFYNKEGGGWSTFSLTQLRWEKGAIVIYVNRIKVTLSAFFVVCIYVFLCCCACVPTSKFNQSNRFLFVFWFQHQNMINQSHLVRLFRFCGSDQTNQWLLSENYNQLWL